MSSELKSTQEVLELIGLAPDEIDVYFRITGRGPVSAGEMGLLGGVDDVRAQEIANSLSEKGLVKEIPGKTKHYSALPPYAALMRQIHQFKESVTGLKSSTPANLEGKFIGMEKSIASLDKFQEYVEFIREMKETLPKKMKEQLSKFENQMKGVQKFHDLKLFILNLKEVVPPDIEMEFGRMQSRLETIKTEIAQAFEKQFRVGALSSFAEKIVSRIIKDQFEEMAGYFRDKVIQTTQNTLDQVIDQLGSITDTAGEISSGIGDSFTNIEAGLAETLTDLETKVTEVNDSIQKGINELKGQFQKEVMETLDEDVMMSVVRQLDLAEKTMQEFWDRSKAASMMTFKDVWFIRSPEAMQAQINEAFTMVKMRLFIICPFITDIDFTALSKVKSRINVRISTDFDLSNPDHKSKVDLLKEMDNVDLRWYPRGTVWALNKDFEEMIVCVVSDDQAGRQVAGMGSVLEQHIKLFAPTIEDVWIQSKKLDQL
jgi:sugar-specific transcriptional regulator TrmB